MSVYSGNVSETMETVRYLFHKYKWMAADVDNKAVLRREKDIAYQIPISEEEMDEMVRLYTSGTQILDICKQTKRSAPSIYRVLKDRKVFKCKGNNKYDKEFKKKLISEILSGSSCKSVAAKHGVNERTLRDWVKYEQ